MSFYVNHTLFLMKDKLITQNGKNPSYDFFRRKILKFLALAGGAIQRAYDKRPTELKAKYSKLSKRSGCWG